MLLMPYLDAIFEIKKRNSTLMLNSDLKRHIYQCDKAFHLVKLTPKRMGMKFTHLIIIYRRNKYFNSQMVSPCFLV